MSEFPGFPASISWDITGGTAWAEIGQTQDLTGPSISAGAEEVSHRGSIWSKFIKGMVDPGEVTFPVVYDASDEQHGGSGGSSLIDSIDDGPCTVPKFKLDYGLCEGTAYWIFDGFVTGFTPTLPLQGADTAELTIKVTGKPTFYYTGGA